MTPSEFCRRAFGREPTPWQERLLADTTVRYIDLADAFRKLHRAGIEATLAAWLLNDQIGRLSDYGISLPLGVGRRRGWKKHVRREKAERRRRGLA